MGFTIDTNNHCLTNPLDGRDVEDRVGHCFLRVSPGDMDWTVPPPDPPLVGVLYISTSCFIPRGICKQTKNWQRCRSLVHSYEARKVRVVKGFVLQA
jgi:hypothetical protein